MLLATGNVVVNARDDHSSTPLHNACKRGMIDSIKLLVAAGADVNSLDARKRTPADVIGEMQYVKHDLVKAIKIILNAASGGFREEASDLKRVRRCKNGRTSVTSSALGSKDTSAYF